MAGESSPQSASADEDIARPTKGASRDAKGWDGKLRVDRRAVLKNTDTPSDAEESDEASADPLHSIDADEGKFNSKQ